MLSGLSAWRVGRGRRGGDAAVSWMRCRRWLGPVGRRAVPRPECPTPWRPPMPPMVVMVVMVVMVAMVAMVAMLVAGRARRGVGR